VDGSLGGVKPRKERQEARGRVLWPVIEFG
jgi:hypothetical protein